MAIDGGGTENSLSLLVAGAALLWSIVTGRRQDKRETDEERMRKDDARRQEIREVALRAVEDSGKFALAGEQELVNLHLTQATHRIENSVRTVHRKLDAIMLAGRIKVTGDVGEEEH